LGIATCSRRCSRDAARCIPLREAEFPDHRTQSCRAIAPFNCDRGQSACGRSNPESRGRADRTIREGAHPSMKGKNGWRFKIEFRKCDLHDAGYKCWLVKAGNAGTGADWANSGTCRACTASGRKYLDSVTGADFQKCETRIKPLAIGKAWCASGRMRRGNHDLHQHRQQRQHPRKTARALWTVGIAVLARHGFDLEPLPFGPNYAPFVPRVKLDILSHLLKSMAVCYL